MTSAADTASLVERAATFLFVPGTREDRYDKAVATGADVVILDLEDTVAVEDKDVARARVNSWLQPGRRAAVRVNNVGTPWFAPDVDVAARSLAVVLPKAECARDVQRVVEATAGQVPVVPLVESPRGLAALAEICAVPQVVRVGFGNVDFAAEVGLDPACHEALVTARSGLVYASSAARLVAPIDGVTTDIRSPDRLLLDVRHARQLGFAAKLLIHPSQVMAAGEVLRPTSDEIAWARGVLASAAGAIGVYEGHMVDEPVLLRARRLLERARG